MSTPDLSQVLSQQHCLENQLSMNVYMVCGTKWVGWWNGMQTPQLASVAEVSFTLNNRRIHVNAPLANTTNLEKKRMFWF